MSSVGTVLLVRHAHALDRTSWDDDDGLRPLSAKGRRQAEALARRFGVDGPDALLSSPAIRCHQTLEPLAAALEQPIVERVELGEGGRPGRGLALLEAEVEASAHRVICASSHGDVIDGILDLVVSAIGPIGVYSVAKAGTLRIEFAGGAVIAATYLPPPKAREATTIA